MKRIPLVTGALLVIATSAWAQNGPYSADNFDLGKGVQATQPVVLAPKTGAGKPGAKKLLGPARNTSATVSSAASLVVPTVLTSGLTVSAPVGSAGALRGYTTGSSEIDEYLIQSGANNGVDALLLYAVMHQESSFKSRAISPKGARGLMQLMPGTAIRYGVTNIFDPKQNIEGGARYLRFLLARYGDVKLALAGYNAGEGAVDKYGDIPPYAETKEYVRRIWGRYSLLKDPNAAAFAQPVNRTQLSRLQAKNPTPLTILERTVSTVRTPDGKFLLMSQ
jgi:soluble lytic murein transglycosylase-like protein